jgi:cyclophilin family peptidyl-prolyl cis-trans isomerase
MHPAATQPLISILMTFFSVLTPQKMWFPPDAPVEVVVNPPADVGPVKLVLTDFTNRALEELKEPLVISSRTTVDVRTLMPDGLVVGTYVLYAVPTHNARKDFVGTPLVISVRADRRQGAPPGPMVVRVAPLCYVRMTTDKGPMTIGFYYDAAPHTVANFLTLAGEDFYDGLSFHRIVPDFIVQGGDPRGDGTGGPGYFINAEFNDRKHEAGVLSMARSVDPNEAGGAMPRADFANSAGSQFFICLNYDNAQQLDKRYTAFGRVIEGMDAVKAIAAVPLANPQTGRPKDPPRILHAEVRPVTAKENPYVKLMEQIGIPSMLPRPEATTQPAGEVSPAPTPR